MNIYINSAQAISPQNTFETDAFLETIEKPELSYFSCQTPNYKEFINPKHLRRMSKVVRMGVANSIKALKEVDIEHPDAIIVGTGLGCLTDTVKFLDQLVEHNESLLNPTAFIQSTHNTVSGAIALLLGCRNYNFTFTQQEVSFETALIDADLMLKQQDVSNILVGGIDEINDKSYELIASAGCAKTTTENILASDTNGYVPGEGAGFFILSNKTSEKNIAQITAISAFNGINKEDGLTGCLEEIITQSSLKIDDIDVLVSGVNGDVDNDENYKSIQEFLNTGIHTGYKHIVGEYDTASSFATWLGAKILQNQTVPEAVKLNSVNKESINNVLIHSYSKGHGHSFIVLSKC